MKKSIVIILITVLLLCLSCDVTSPEIDGELVIPRGRPQIINGTIVTEIETHLRGAYWSTDWIGELPEREKLTGIKDYGLNSLHLYAERHDAGLPAGIYKDEVDSIVKWCGELGLYCVITIGGGNHNGEFDYDFAMDFWDIYAPRYADDTWVIYEIFNEPYGWEAPYDSATLRMEQDVYNLIRNHATNTPILFFSYATFSTVDDMLQDINNLEVDWSNALVAWHGYNSLTDEILINMKTEGINSISTELPADWIESEPRVNAENIRICEENNVSWLVFLNINEVLESWRFKEIITRNEIFWEPDFGTWPSDTSGYTLPQNLALNKTVYVSSVERDSLEGENAVDGNMETRWSSEFQDPQYITVDLGDTTDITRVILEWDYASAIEYEIQVSNDNENWTTLAHVTNGDGGMDVISLSASARYVRMYGTRRNTEYGYSLYEFEIVNITD
jgi:hypothetical protein